MSQIVTQENLKELDTAPIFNDSIDRRISTLINDSIDEFVKSGMDLITSGIVSGQSKNQQITSQVISSPQQMKMGFKNYFIHNMGEINTGEVLAKQKTAVIKTLQSMDYRIEKPEQVLTNMKVAMESANIKEFAAKVDVLMSDIEMQHTNYLIKNASVIIQQATMSVGFAEDMMVNTIDNKTVVSASKDGKALLTEIAFDRQKNKIDIITETIEFEGEGCDSVMEAFQKELEAKGLKFAASNKKWTGGDCWLPSSKTIEKQLKKRVSSKEAKDHRRQNMKRNSQINSHLKH
ncbi:MAG: hypothetical protein IH594_02720 [Bacteroidales bacterium]|nr:hypothetical protein [Bacteroidales bacterium]